MRDKIPMTVDQVRSFLDELFSDDMHAKRVDSLARGTLGVLQGAALGVHVIGHGLAVANGVTDKHAIKLVDRLLSNAGIEVWGLFELWVPAMLGEREEAIVVLDWTDFPDNDQSLLMLSLITNHGRATPLVWRTVKKSELGGQQHQHEAEVVLQFLEAKTESMRVTLLADRGFDDHRFMDFLKGLCGIDFVIRFRCNTLVEAEDGETRPAKDWVGAGGRAKMLRNAKITQKKFEVATVVCTQDKEMKQPWCLVSSRTKSDAQAFVKWYAKRWSIEASFRDLKNPILGLGLEDVRMERCDRRDRMVLVAAFAIVLMTLLGAAGELVKIDWMLKANTTKQRTLSLLRQGFYWNQRIGSMKEEHLLPLMTKFGELVQEHAVFKRVFGWA